MIPLYTAILLIKVICGLKRYVLTSAAWVTGAFNKAKEKLTAEPGSQPEHELNPAGDGLTTVIPSETRELTPLSTPQPEVEKSNEETVEEPVEESKEKPAYSEPPKKPEPATGLVL